MRIRSTKPEFWTSKTIAALPWDVRLVLKGLESYVDDNGVGKDDIALIAADVFPRDLSSNPRDTLARLSEAISVLSEAGLIARYELDDEELLYIDKWKDLQRIDKPARGRFRRPDGTLEYSEEVSRESYRKPREDFGSPREKVAPGTGEQGNRGTGEMEQGIPPTAGGGEVGATLALVSEAPTAQTIVAEWIDHCPERPPGDVIGQIAKNTKKLLDEGIDPTRVRAALAEWNRKGLHPATLSSVVHEISNRRPAARGQAATNDLFDAAMHRALAKDGMTR
jgi:hypothetical protein